MKKFKFTNSGTRNANNYNHKQTKKEDKYEGLFSKKQLADLDGGIDDLVVTVVSKKEIQDMIKEQRTRGVGNTMWNPFVFGEQ